MFRPFRASVVERTQRSIFKTLARFMKQNKTSSFIDELQSIVSNYNNRYHRSIKMAPNEVTEHNLSQVSVNLYHSENDKTNALEYKPKFKKNQHVLISRDKTRYQKGYASNYKEEVFKISKIHKGVPILYTLSDACDENTELLGRFYEKELTPVTIPKVLEISKVLDSEVKRNGSKKYLVKFTMLPECPPQWVSLGYLKQGASKEILKSLKLSK